MTYQTKCLSFVDGETHVAQGPEIVVAARYVLCATVDEAVMSTPGGSQSEWAQNPLLVALHREAWGGEKFFEMLDRIARDPARHIDLMDMLAMYQPRAYAPLDQLAQLCGLPGKLGMGGGEVWRAWQAGEIGAIRNYCETDVVNTWLLYLRFQRMRGMLTGEQYDAETRLVRQRLVASGLPHWQAFVAAWPDHPGACD